MSEVEVNANEASVSEATETATETAAPVETPQTVTPASVAEVTQEVVTEEKPKFQPNYKFKVYDQEKEFDDWIKPLVNEENEAKIREVMEKAHGIDFIKEKLNNTRQEAATIQMEHQNLVQGIQQLQSAIKSNSVHDIKNVLGISNQDIKNWAVEVLRYEEMNPQDRQIYDNSFKYRQEAELYKTQSQTLADQMSEIKSKQLLYEVKNTITSDPSKSEFVQQLNERLKPIYGEDGFIREVGMVGSTFFRQNGFELDASQAVDFVLKKFGYTEQIKTPTIPKQVVESKPVPVKVITKNDNTIPNPKSSGSGSPASKKITSVEQLKKLAREASSTEYPNS